MEHASPEFLPLNAVRRHFLWIKNTKKSISAGALPRTLAGELTPLTQTP